ncbi:polysaccharide deacetylase family protein [Flammeovirga pacifica]|uniref:NodB homology domain-containing protein n=1 Tax=Flammeovirga pacifica TaxID=915059 RepID=A0A1S1Z1N2_FLAPC|nr:polysaccharide deacetylase family protein [Flammeovirga pacifica]OHX67015.1 hypothetical protein NH26_12005 [Flammeovirga pacifica]
MNNIIVRLLNIVLPKNFKRIICLHSISNNYFSLSKFKALVKVLKLLDITFLSLDDIMNNNLPGRFISFTFDDGYKDNIETLMPFLINEKIPSLIFICPYLLNRGYDIDLISEKKLYEAKLATETDIKLWLDNNFAIGYHTLNHVDLFDASDDEIKNDIEVGIKYLEQKFDYKVNNFAYPFGHLPKNRELLFNLLEKNKVTYAYTVIWGDINFESTPYLINRVCIGDFDSLYKATLKAVGVLDFYFKMKHANEKNRI